MPEAATAEAFADDLTAILVRIDGIEPWKLRPPDEDDPTDTTATLLVGDNLARVRGRLDSRDYTVRGSDVPVREGFAGLLEIQP